MRARLFFADVKSKYNHIGKFFFERDFISKDFGVGHRIYDEYDNPNKFEVGDLVAVADKYKDVEHKRIPNVFKIHKIIRSGSINSIYYYRKDTGREDFIANSQYLRFATESEGEQWEKEQDFLNLKLDTVDSFYDRYVYKFLPKEYFAEFDVIPIYRTDLEDKKMELKELNKKNLKEAKKQFEEEKANEEILFAKQQYKEMYNTKLRLEREIKTRQEQIDEIDKKMAIFNK